MLLQRIRVQDTGYRILLYGITELLYPVPCALLAELLQEPLVAAEEPADVVDAILQDADPLGPEAAGEAAEFGGVVAAVAQHVRVDHATAADLQPARVLADPAALAAAQEA